MSDTIEDVTVTEIPKDPITAVVAFDDAARRMLTNAMGAIEVAKACQITCVEDCQDAVVERNQNLKEITMLEDTLKGLTEPARLIIERARAIFKPGIERRKEAVKLLNDMIGTWEVSERKRIADETRKAEEEARKLREKAEQEAAAARAKAEAEAAEARRKAEAAEAARRKAEAEGNAKAAAKAAQEAAKLTEKARQAEETGSAVAQQKLMEAAAATPVLPIPVAKVEGNTSRPKWVAELAPGVTLDDAKRMVVAAIVAGRGDLLALWDFNDTALRKCAEALKGNMSVPGFVAVEKSIQVGKRK